MFKKVNDELESNDELQMDDKKRTSKIMDEMSTSSDTCICHCKVSVILELMF
jgi:hypothetical protein